MGAVAPRTILQWSHIEEILRFIDSIDSETPSPLDEGLSVAIGNFGVFAAECSSSACSAATAGTLIASGVDDALPARDTLREACQRADDGEPRPQSSGIDALDYLVSPSSSEAAAAWDLCNLQSHRRPSLLDFPASSLDETGVDLALSDGTIHHHDASSLAPDTVDSFSVPSTWELLDPSCPTPRSGRSPSMFNEQERYLMHHYLQRVVNIFCVIDNAKSPWKTIHLPRVLQCMGELTVTGSTTRIRTALKNALLSISAFYLSNDRQAHPSQYAGQTWANIASRYRCSAIGLLKESVENDLYSGGNPKYKEFLATMLSMITINATLQVDPQGDAIGEMDSFECIYGIPRILLEMLKETTEVMGQLDHVRAKAGTIPEALAKRCDNLEKTILDWPLEEQLHRCWETSKGDSAHIIYHQTRSFHNALIIYFSQNVRLLRYRYLRPYVEAVLESIEAIEQIKAETKILAAPLFWPAFIGATEAFEPQHQDRFRQWYDRVAIYGIEAVRTGIQVIFEVWKRGPALRPEPVCSWRLIVQRLGISMMLT
ncbi:Uncharacterized protein TPAR_02966 [Tolypocladium paradoxum]|uniref:Arginine metabolism regulation protein II n=1 Tax=Tolypocladium paradoxum TaxID=94208 RepID=A0A2S4L312_9HYPO|nr:Uncharacterized protein TPAR_02966 [Tolypocladium paradoxum]